MSRYVQLRHPKDGSDCVAIPEHAFDKPGLAPEDPEKSYEDLGYEIVAYDNGEAYDGEFAPKRRRAARAAAEKAEPKKGE
jgi:hypothetical protein